MTSESFVAEGPAGSLAGVDQAPAGGGHGLPVLLVHGINMSKDVWTDVADRVAEHRRVVSFDLRGHGESAKQGPYTESDYADDALAVLDAKGIERAHIVGTSFGGSTAVSLASRHPRACRLDRIVRRRRCRWASSTSKRPRASSARSGSATSSPGCCPR